MADIERLDRVLAWIEAHPEQHDQGVWARDIGDDGKVNCGTAMCLAGWVVALDRPDALFVRDDLDMMTPGRTYSQVQTEDGNVVSVEAYAGELLGIDRKQQVALFEASNTIEHLKAMRDILAANRQATYTELEAVHNDDDGPEWDDWDDEGYPDEADDE